MNLVTEKSIGLTIMFMGNIVLGLIPLKLVSWLRNAEIEHPRFRNVLGLINCFTGGVFFGTFLIHLLPDVIEDFAAILIEWDIKTTFPIAEFTISLGFFFVMIIESIVGMCHMSHRRERELTTRSSNINSTKRDNGYGSCEGENGNNGPVVTENQSSYESDVEITFTTDLQSSMETIDVLRDTSLIRAFIFLLSLSLHSLFAGLAIGLVRKETNALMLIIAVCGHKWIIAFALGIELVQVSLSRLKCVIYMVVFALMSPIGVVIGICVDEDTTDMIGQQTASCVLQAMAAGTFLFVTFFEVLGKELNDRHDMMRILSILVGFSIMTGFKFLE